MKSLCFFKRGDPESGTKLRQITNQTMICNDFKNGKFENNSFKENLSVLVIVYLYFAISDISFQYVWR